MFRLYKSTFILTMCLMIFMTTGLTAYADQSSVEKLAPLSYEEYIDQLDNSSNIKINERSFETENQTDKMVNVEDLAKGKEKFDYDNSIKNNEINISSNENRNNGASLMAAPIPGLDTIVINPETLKNGQPTTDTLIAWLYADIDSDGDTIVNRQIGGFPWAYFLGELSDGSGFVTQFTDPDSYTLCIDQ